MLLILVLTLCFLVGVTAGHAADPEPAEGLPLPALTPISPTGWYPKPPPLPFPRPTPPGSGSAGFNTRVQLPAIDHRDGWETWIQVQNIGYTSTKAIAFLWDDYSGACPPGVPGPLTAVCTGLLAPGSAWSWAEHLLPPNARGGIVYSVPESIADDACEEAFSSRGSHHAWLQWEREFAGTGQPIAVTVNRIGPGSEEGLIVASSYTGISREMEGVRDPLFGGFMYYAPVLYNTFAGLDSELTIQNSGDECSSLEIWYHPHDDCQRSVIQEIGVLAPGESVRIVPEGLPVASVGSAWIRASQPLGIAVDHWGNNQLMTYRAVPADSYGVDFTAGAPINYIPLTYREFNGWDTTIHVQNLSSTNSAKVKVVFLDNGGNTIATTADWVCPRGSRAFYLPAINDLPGHYVGAAIVTSQGWFSPGDPDVNAARVSSVVTLINAGAGQAVAYNALTPQESVGIGAVGIPLLVQNRRGITSQLAVQNLNPNAGSASFNLLISDQNGSITSFCFWLNSGQVIHVDLTDIRILNQGFRGSAVVRVATTGQRGLPAIGAIMIEHGAWPGDQSKATEGVPMPAHEPPQHGYGCR